MGGQVLFKVTVIRAALGPECSPRSLCRQCPGQATYSHQPPSLSCFSSPHNPHAQDKITEKCQGRDW